MNRLIVFFMVLVALATPSFSWGNNNLVAGGGGSPTTWEIRDSGGGFVSNGTLNASRSNHCGVLVSSGNVFIAGGTVSSSTWEMRSGTGSLVSSGSLPVGRDVAFTCNVLSTGNIMIVGSTASPGNWEIRGGPICLDRMFRSLSGASRCSDYAAVSRVVRLSKYTFSGVLPSSALCGLCWL